MGLVSPVDGHVNPQVHLRGKAFATDVAAEGALSTVESQVEQEVVLVPEVRVAYRALVGALRAVGDHVTVEVILPFEAPSTNFTREWFFGGVNEVYVFR